MLSVENNGLAPQKWKTKEKLHIGIPRKNDEIDQKIGEKTAAPMFNRLRRTEENASDIKDQNYQNEY